MTVDWRAALLCIVRQMNRDHRQARTPSPWRAGAAMRTPWRGLFPFGFVDDFLLHLIILVFGDGAGIIGLFQISQLLAQCRRFCRILHLTAAAAAASPK